MNNENREVLLHVEDLKVTFGNRPVKIRVLSDVEQKGKDVAREMFEVIEG